MNIVGMSEEWFVERILICNDMGCLLCVEYLEYKLV